MASCETMKVKPWGEGQGEFVIINADDFDPNFHKPLNASEPSAGEAPKPKAKAKAKAKK